MFTYQYLEITISSFGGIVHTRFEGRCQKRSKWLPVKVNSIFWQKCSNSEWRCLENMETIRCDGRRFIKLLLLWLKKVKC